MAAVCYDVPDRRNPYQDVSSSDQEALPEPPEQYFWTKTFLLRRSFDPRVENVPYIDFLRSEWAGVDCAEASHEECERGEEEDEEEQGPEDENLTRVFMRGRLFMSGAGVQETYRGQAEEVEKFCGPMSLGELSKRSVEKSKWSVALLDERNEKGQSRPYRGWLTASQLYEELRKQVRYGLPERKDKSVEGL
jgi:hypothetical protein